MAITKVSIRDFRCFATYSLELHRRLTVIQGANGSGKTSLLEAIYSASSLRSFRTASVRELIAHGAEAFSVKVTTDTDDSQLAYGTRARVVELNGRGPSSRLALMDCMPVIAVTEQDMELVQGAPLMRRAFLDYTAAQRVSSYIQEHKALSEVLAQRNALLLHDHRWDRDMYQILTERLAASTEVIRTVRQVQLRALEVELQRLLVRVLPHNTPQLQMRYVRGGVPEIQALDERQERRYRRSLYGAQLDDMVWNIEQFSARRYVSRGMQKLLVILARCAQAQLLPRSTVLFDDIMADFDEARLHAVVATVLDCAQQLVMTIPQSAPSARSALSEQLAQYERSDVIL
jgi:DNA replication and repair protein RecF